LVFSTCLFCYIIFRPLTSVQSGVVPDMKRDSSGIGVGVGVTGISRDASADALIYMHGCMLRQINTDDATPSAQIHHTQLLSHHS
jgi:hypothetical protein